MPGRTFVPPSWTAFSACGFRPSMWRIVGATWVVSTQAPFFECGTVPGA